MVFNVFHFLTCLPFALLLWLYIANCNKTILYLQKIVKKINEKEIRYQVCRLLVHSSWPCFRNYNFISVKYVLQYQHYAINSPIQDRYMYFSQYLRHSLSLVIFINILNESDIISSFFFLSVSWETWLKDILCKNREVRYEAKVWQKTTCKK